MFDVEKMLLHFAAVLYLVGAVSSQTICSGKSLAVYLVGAVSSQTICSGKSLAVYLVGSVSSQTICSGPEGVSQLKAVNNSVSSIAVQWEPPSNTDCLEEYQVCWSLADGSQSNCSTQTILELETTNITGLTGCTNYIINVTSVSSSGDYSETVSIATSTAPQKMKRVQIWSSSVSNITAIWTLPSHTQCLQGIQVCLSPRDGNQSNCTIQSSHSHAAWTFTELTPCSHYIVNVTLISLSGEYSEAVTASAVSGTALNTSSSSIHNVDVPCLAVSTISNHDVNVDVGVPCLAPALSKVNNFRAVTSSSSIQLDWEAPTEGTECLEEYSVCWKITGDSTTNCTSQSVDLPPSLNLTEPEICANYTFTLTASGARGESAGTTASAIICTYKH
uniref:Fibronectin type-III domain-containing protein n=1 Tax=Timema shepardi TaxID=629360 RepID=A0A7R9AS18_TIMSH|nr:unnamed protein product [Timema shepardi]